MNISSFRSPLALTLALAACLASFSLFAQATTMPAYPSENKNVMSLDASATSEVIPDTAFVTLAAEASGAEVGPITREVQQLMSTGLTQAKTGKDIEARTGAFSTQPRYNSKGNRDGWTVRAELIVKSKDFAALGALASKLSEQKLMITSTGFELSTAQRAREETGLIERAIQAFGQKASIATKAFGFSGYSLREVNIGSTGGGMPSREPMMQMREMQRSAPAAPSMTIEGGKTVLSLAVSGTVVMSK